MSMKITASLDESIFRISKWLGLNENPDGDTQLKAGEAAEMHNFKITGDGNLQKRPGMAKIHQTRNWTGAIRGIWHGFVGGVEYTVFAAGGNIYKYDFATNTATSILKPGTTYTDAPTTFFGFQKNLYMLNGNQYLVWDGSMPPSNGVIPVVGYVPLVSISVPPSGGGTLKEGINKLSAVRKIQFSPTGSDVVFQLPETGQASIDYVKNTATGTNYTLTTDYTVDTTKGQVSFVAKARTENFTAMGNAYPVFYVSQNTYSVTNVTVASSNYSYQYNPTLKAVTLLGTPTNGQAVAIFETYAPALGTNTVEVQYTMPTSGYSQVTAMKYAEIYNGKTDNRVFIYGDGSNKAYYSGLDGNGLERADHFPDLNVLNVGSANSPITALVRHYSQMAAFKSDSAYTVDYGNITLANNQIIAAFYIIPNNRTTGNVAYGQAQLVDNSPRTLFGGQIYAWKNNASYSSNLTLDERQAQRISKRVTATLGGMDLTQAYTYDYNEGQEYYVIQNKTAIIHNYGTDAWYVYKNFDIAQLISIGGELYGCTTAGDFVRIHRDYLDDNGTPIDCYWRSGSIPFERPWSRKYSAKIFVTMKPEKKANVLCTIRTNVKDVYVTKTIAHGFMSFVEVNFAHWSFGMNTSPQTDRLKIKAKKFTYYQLVFETAEVWNRATILAAEIKVKYTGDEK